MVYYGPGRWSGDRLGECGPKHKAEDGYAVGRGGFSKALTPKSGF